jgi:hypothetical protein
VPTVISERTNDAVRSAIERWVRLLGDLRFYDAMAMLAPSKDWTAELLATVIRNYGFIEPLASGRTFAVTPIESAVGEGPRFEVTWFDTGVERRPDDARVGFADYDLPLNDEWSDVTATFDIVDSADGLVLWLDDVRVM